MKSILLSIITIGFFGCTSPKQEDFVGIWIGDNVKLELKSDSSCVATGRNAYLLLGKDVYPTESNLTIQGHWEFTYRSYKRSKIFESKRIEISFKNNDTYREYGNILYYNKSLMSNSCTLYFDLSDPDDMNRFKFEKQK